MSDKGRAWTIAKSIQIALIVGGIAGLLTVGMTYNSFVGDLEPRGSLLAGAGVALALTLILSYVFDQMSHSAQTILRATRRNKKPPTTKSDEKK